MRRGLGLAFCSFSFGGMTAFSVLLYVERGWRTAWLSFTTFAIAFIVARLWLSHLADRASSCAPRALPLTG